MNQTKKRLSIINLAISMTDIETIQLQILKLGLLKSDDKIQEIIETLYETNYAKAQSLIIEYIETPHHEILQRTFQKEKEKFQKQKRSEDRFHKSVVHEEEAPEAQQEPKTEKELMNEFDLFDVPAADNTPTRTIIDLDDMINMHNRNQEKEKKKEQDVSFDSLLNIKSDDVMPDNIKINIEQAKAPEDFWDLDDSETEENPIEKDTFFDAEIPEAVTQHTPAPEKEEAEEETEATREEESDDTASEELQHEEESKDLAPDDQDADREEEVLEETEDEEHNKEEENKNDILHKEQEKDTSSINYEATTYINQKYKNTQVQYPVKEKSDERFESVDKWLLQISKEGYSESDVEEMIKKIDALRVEHKSEAAQLLLVTGATQSKYAQFRLARALYTGDILEKNPAAAFNLINDLAIKEEYPEAICDLAQFYEYGIGISKDKKQAALLYREAMELGIQRAEAHVKRLEKEKKGFFSFGKK